MKVLNLLIFAHTHQLNSKLRHLQLRLSCHRILPSASNLNLIPLTNISLKASLLTKPYSCRSSHMSSPSLLTLSEPCSRQEFAILIISFTTLSESLPVPGILMSKSFRHFRKECSLMAPSLGCLILLKAYCYNSSLLLTIAELSASLLFILVAQPPFLLEVLALLRDQLLLFVGFSVSGCCQFPSQTGL